LGFIFGPLVHFGFALLAQRKRMSIEERHLVAKKKAFVSDAKPCDNKEVT